MPRRAKTWLHIAASHITLGTNDVRVGVVVAGGVLVIAAFAVFPGLTMWLQEAKARFLAALIFQWASLGALTLGTVFMPPLRPFAHATRGRWLSIAGVTLAIAALYAVAGG